jgi:hypothetical protein
MKDAYRRFGWLTYANTTADTRSTIRLRVDRFIGEVLPDPPRRAKVHLISVLGGDTQIAAISAAVSTGELSFEVEGPEFDRIPAACDAKTNCYRGSVQAGDSKRQYRHLVAVSKELAAQARVASCHRVILAAPNSQYVWSSVADFYGLPGCPIWDEWFMDRLECERAIKPLLGIGCNPVLVKGSKQQFLTWIGRGLASGEIEFPEKNGPIQRPNIALLSLFQAIPD